ncbi:hypothetical protein TEA_028019 [Camellia sinensis var. sinensis]|uniref:Uncharacterized protein n=1 Tax=Camellia sinensis var. sinensis TaxID=542762 RepID=A0A4S4E0W2_CAMSN|nr:hypothetical protein TEA_028019 [Camellia sinensis var. sinensis]
MAPGHFIPMIDIAKLLAQHGVTVTVVTTPLIASRFNPIINRAIESGLPLRLLSLRFPSVEAGLPEGCETVDTVPSLDLIRNFYVAIFLLQEPFEQLFETLEPSPSCIIADKIIAWLADTARKFQIPRIIFDGTSCFTLLCTHNLHITKVHESVSESEPFELPGLPEKIQLKKSQLPPSINPGSLLVVQDFRVKIQAAEAEAYGVVINSFEELESRYVDGYRKVKGDKVWCIGPLSLCNKDNLDKAQRGNKAAIDENQCLKWLDEQEPGSVVYACLGSIGRLSPLQLIEIGLGLEASKRPFVWVIKGGAKAAEIEKWVEEDGFEERVQGKGLVIRGWAPQVLEAGVSVGAQAIGHMFGEDKCTVLVKREVVREAVEEVMGEGIEGEERRRRARVLGEMAEKAMEEGGSSYLNVRLLIQDVIKQGSHKESIEEDGACGS